MSTRKTIVDKYIDGFRRSDHEQVLSCLTDDIRWEIYGHATVRGKIAFDAAIENDDAQATPMGVALDTALAPLGAWGEDHMEQIRALRRA